MCIQIFYHMLNLNTNIASSGMEFCILADLLIYAVHLILCLGYNRIQLTNKRLNTL